MKFSVIIPVYNRPHEIRELLESLQNQSYSDFEVVIVEDGSYIKSEEIAASFSPDLGPVFLSGKFRSGLCPKFWDEKCFW